MFGAAATGLLVPAVASAAPQAPAPTGDDAGFLAFGATAESVGLAFYERAQHAGLPWTGAERRRLARGEDAKRDHIGRLNAALGPDDAVRSDDFAEVFAARALADRAAALTLGMRLEELAVGVYLNGAAYAGDAGTRMLLGRLIASCSEQLAQLRVLAGRPAAGGLASPVDLEPAGARLDAYLVDPA